MVSFIVRTATENDAQAIVNLIIELAQYQNMADQVRITADHIKNHGLRAEGEPWFHANVAALVGSDGEDDIVGYAIYFFKHDILRDSRVVYMEDLYVQPAYRGQGIGMALWRSIATHGLQERCSALKFTVLSWNTQSIEFYKRLGATCITDDEGVRVYRMNRETIKTVMMSRE